MTKTEMAMNMGSGAVDRYKNGGPIVYIIEGRSLSRYKLQMVVLHLKELLC